MTSRFFFTTLFSALTAAGIVIFGQAALEANVTPTISAEARPLPVSATRYEEAATYISKSRFLGVIEASSDSNMGFEVAGVLKALNVGEGDYVTTGQLLGKLDTRQQEAALSLVSAQAREVLAQLELAKLNLDRVTTMMSQQLTSQSDLDDARLRVDSLTARLETTEASVRNAEIVIEKSALRAPFDAVVSDKLAEAGSIVGPAVPVLRLVSVGEREAHIGISPKYANLVTVGETYQILADNRVLSAELRTIGDDVDTETLTVRAVLPLPKDDQLRVGQTVALELAEEVDARGGWLPISALIEGEKGLWTVLIAQKDASGETITYRESVEVVHSKDNQVFVRGTLSDGDLVIASGLQRLSPGSPVEIVPQIRMAK